MKKTIFGAALVAALCLAGVTAEAQDFSLGARTGAEVDWKIVKGLHLNAAYELRSRPSLAGVERNQASLGIDYKVCDFFKVGAEYIFIGHQTSSDELEPRHRLSLNLTGQYDYGVWRFSLREKLQMTHKAYDVNEYQEVPNALQLKSRFTVKYRGFRSIEPYVYAEVRNIFNAPRCSATWNEVTGAYSDYKFLGYDNAYVNRLRGAAGFEWELSKHHSLDFTAMYHWTHDQEMDTNKKGTKLKSLFWQNDHSAVLCVTYKFSF